MVYKTNNSSCWSSNHPEDDSSTSSFDVVEILQQDGKKQKNADHKTTKTRNVTFDTSKNLIHHDDKANDNASNSDPDKLWYSNTELHSIKRNNCKIVRQLRKGLFTEGEHSARGLEHKVIEGKNNDGYQSRKERRLYVTMIVMTEQLRQLMDDINDPNAIADVYHSVVANCQETAYAMGAFDMKEAAS